MVDELRPAPQDLRHFQSLKPPVRREDPWYMVRGESAAEELQPNVIWDSNGIPARWRDPFIGFRCAKDPQ
jgi:hypothetical protein